MTLTQPMAALERSCRLATGSLAKLNLHSLQDICTHSEAAFLKQFASTLGHSLATTVHRTARSGQQQLIRLFYHAARHPPVQPNAEVPLQVVSDLLGAEQPDTRPVTSLFDHSAATWRAQFPDTHLLAPPASVGDSSSPASYAASLYALATRLEKVAENDAPRISLAIRRPDLAGTLLSDVTLNQAVAKLDLVNGILRGGLAEQKNNQALIAALQKQLVLPTSMTELPVEALLARLHFPSSALPYHEPHDQIGVGLAAQHTHLAVLTREVLGHTPTFADSNGDLMLASRVLQQAADLSPPYLSLLTAPPVFQDTDAPPLTPKQAAYFSYNYGTSTSAVDALDQLPDFAQTTGLNDSQILQLFCIAGLGENNSTVTASPNVSPLPSATTDNSRATQYGAVFIHAGQPPMLFLAPGDGKTPTRIAGLSVGSGAAAHPFYHRYERIDRLQRLQRCTGLAFDHLDNLVVAAMRAEGQRNKSWQMNTHTARALGFYKQWHAAYGLCVEDAAALLHQLSAFATQTAVPQFDRVFNAAASTTASAPLRLDGTAFIYAASEGDDAATVRQLCAGLKVSAAEFLLLADIVNTAQGLAAGQLTRNLVVVSALYRLSKVAALLGLRPASLFSLLSVMPRGPMLRSQLAGTPLLSELDANGQPKTLDMLDDLQALADLVRWLAEQKLSADDLTLLLGAAPTPMQAGPADVAVISAINQHLHNSLLSDSQLQKLPLPVTDSTDAPLDWFALLSDKTNGVIDASGLVRIESPALRNKALATLIAELKLTDAEKALACSLLSNSLDGLSLNQQAVIDTQLGSALHTPHGMVLAILAWLKQDSYTLLRTCLALDHPDLAPAEIPASLLTTLNSLARYNLVASHFSLSTSVLALINTLPKAFGGDLDLNLALLPVLADYATWRQASGNEDHVLQYLLDVNASAPPAVAVATVRLAELVNADSREVQQGLDLIAQASPGTGRATTVTQVGHLMRLLEQSQQTGLSISQLGQVTALDIHESVLPEKATDDLAFANWRIAGLAVMASLAANDRQNSP